MNIITVAQSVLFGQPAHKTTGGARHTRPVHVYACIYIHVHVYMYMYNMYIYNYTCIYVCMYVYMYISYCIGSVSYKLCIPVHVQN